MPENNPAVCVAEFEPSPGMQPVNEMHITVIIRNNINFLSVFIYFPPLSINGFRIVLIHTKLKYCQKQPPWEAICFLANDKGRLLASAKSTAYADLGAQAFLGVDYGRS